MDGWQMPRMAVLAPALERLLAAPMSSWSHFPGLVLMAKFFGGAASCLLVKTVFSLA